MNHTVHYVKFFGVGSGANGQGQRPLLHGYVVRIGKRACRNYLQGSAQKWTLELSTKLFNEAKAWASHLDEVMPEGRLR